MGSIAGAAGGVASSAIQAQAMKDMLATKMENYWRRTDQIDRVLNREIYTQNRHYNRDYADHVHEIKMAQQNQRNQYTKMQNDLKNAYDKTIGVYTDPSTDVYGGQRTYTPGLGYQYKMAPQIKEQFQASIDNDRRLINAGNTFSINELPRAFAQYAGRPQYTEAQLYQDKLTDALHGDWRARAEMGNRLGLASVRGGNRSNWAEKIQDYLREDSRDRDLRLANARSSARGESIALNQASDQQAAGNLQNALSFASLGSLGEKHGAFADNKLSNPTGMQNALAGAISNVEPQMEAYARIAGTYQAPPMRKRHELDKRVDFMKYPSLPG